MSTRIDYDLMLKSFYEKRKIVSSSEPTTLTVSTKKGKAIISYKENNANLGTLIRLYISYELRSSCILELENRRVCLEKRVDYREVCKLIEEFKNKVLTCSECQGRIIISKERRQYRRNCSECRSSKTYTVYTYL